MVRLGIGDGGAQHLLHRPGGTAIREGEDGASLRNGAAADVLGDEPRLARRHPHPLGLGPYAGRWLHHRHQVARFTWAWRSPEWPRNVRVGANSPSLWPTICSVTKTGTCLRPSCTAIVWPTISGKMVEDRDQVRIIRLEPDSFIDSIRRSSRSSTNGPFLDDLRSYLFSSSPERSEGSNQPSGKCGAFFRDFIASPYPGDGA